MSYLVGHFDLCSGCAICGLACSAREFGGYNPRLANLEITLSGDGLTHHPVVCHQCRNPFCQRSCPVEAISRDEHTGALLVDPEKCTGCGACVSACPLSVIKLVAGVAHKCDLCGGDPLCVKVCPAGALAMVSEGEGNP